MQQGTQHRLFVGRLRLTHGLIAVSDHMDGPPQLDDPAAQHVIPLLGSLLDTQAVLLISEGIAIVAISTSEKSKDFLIRQRLSLLS